MRDRQCTLNHDAIESAAIVSGVINRPTMVTCIPTTCCGEIFYVHNAEIAYVTMTTPT